MEVHSVLMVADRLTERLYRQATMLQRDTNVVLIIQQQPQEYRLAPFKAHYRFPKVTGELVMKVAMKYSPQIIHAFDISVIRAIKERLPNLPLVLDVDSFTTFNTTQDPTLQQIREEEYAFSLADVLAFSSEEFVECAVAKYRIERAKMSVVSNASLKTDPRPTKVWRTVYPVFKKYSKVDGKLHFAYVNDTSSFKRLPTILRNLKELVGNDGIIHIYSDNIKLFHPEVRRNNLTNFVCEETKNHQERAYALTRHDYGLIVMTTDPLNLNEAFAIPNVFYDYLYSGLPVVSQKGLLALGEMIKFMGCGYISSRVNPDWKRGVCMNIRGITIDEHKTQLAHTYQKAITRKGF